MGNVFQGWRRKTGCVTLLMALTVLAAWGRSQISADTFSIPLAGGIQYQASLRQTDFCLIKTRTVELKTNEFVTYLDGDFFVSIHREPIDEKQSQETVESQPDGNVGEHVMSITGPTSVLIDCGQTVIPYWYLMTPLTLISAVLLLTKSRVTAPRQSVEPIKEKNT